MHRTGFCASGIRDGDSRWRTAAHLGTPFRGDRSRPSAASASPEPGEAVIEAHGGTVAVKSQPAVGSEFTVAILATRLPFHGCNPGATSRTGLLRLIEQRLNRLLEEET